MPTIKIKRIYGQKEKDDGFRILVDRLWPRGVSKEKAALDLWFKEIAPSNELRKWFKHDPKKWELFKEKYESEITENKENFKKIKEIIDKEKIVTLLYSAKDEKYNEAVVLKNLLEK
ncbi:MAG TPA: DUF488 domain-containing protein [Candidatus Pacearchaeota archaeon]|nr:DUF488 domain-containing protein [Candidatus Pacearchaeota archaeon]